MHSEPNRDERGGRSGCRRARPRERTELAPALGRTWTDGDPWRFLTDLTAIGSRMAGSEGERRAAEIVADAFERAGLSAVETRPFRDGGVGARSATLRVTAPGRDGAAATREFEALALPYSPGGSVTGELVDVGYGTPAEIDEREVEGRIAVASTTTPEGGRFVHRMEKFGYALDAGAVGFVFVNHLDGQLPHRIPDLRRGGRGRRRRRLEGDRRVAPGVRGRGGRRVAAESSPLRRPSCR